MGYLIDPKVFYWMSVLGSLDFFLVFFGIIFVVVLLIVLSIYFMVKFDSDFEEECKMIEKFLKPIPIVLALILFFGVPAFIPSQKVMTQMLVASQVTHENIEGVQQSATELIDYIVDKINEVEKEE